MTKTEYREYIASADWRERRGEFLLKFGSFCFRCWMPRWLASIAYDQDLHVHHKTYANLGSERDEDLESLCRRCHEMETFGRSDLNEPKSAICASCGDKHWDPYSDLCVVCRWHAEGVRGCVICGRSFFYPDCINTSGTCDACSSLVYIQFDRLQAVFKEPMFCKSPPELLKLFVNFLAVITSTESVLDVLATGADEVATVQREIREDTYAR